MINTSHLAESVARRLADFLCADVSVVDERGCLVASAQLDPLQPVPPSRPTLRLPVQLQGSTLTLLVRPSCDEELVSPRLVRSLIDLIAEQASVVARLPNHNELKNRFVHALLQGDIESDDAVLREAQILGMDITRPRSVIVIDAARYIGPWTTRDSQAGEDFSAQRRAQTVIASVVNFFSLPNATICAYIGNGEVAVLKASSSQDLNAWTDQNDRQDQPNPSWVNLPALKRASAALASRLERDTGTEVRIGIGRNHSGIRGLARSYQDARAALSLGKRFLCQPRVHCLDSLGVAAFVGVPDERTKVDIAMRLLSPLDQEPDLIDTLEAFFKQNCSPSLASNQLAIHRNTLSYRLDKIASLTGLDPRRFDDAVQARLALVLRDISAQEASALAVEPPDSR